MTTQGLTFVNGIRHRVRPSIGLILSLWAALLPLAWIATTSSAADTPPRSGLVFCAYNVKNWLRMDRFENNVVTKDSAKPQQEKAAVIDQLKAISPDVLGLSEIGGAEDLTEIQTLLKESGIDLPESELAEGGDPTRRLGLLSRFPITKRQSVSNLTYQLDGQTFTIQRGILDATIQPRPNLHFRFIGVHLKSMREVPEADQALMRRNEASLLRKHLDDILIESPETPILLYGDFNEHRHEAPIKAIHGSRTGAQYMEDIRIQDKRGETWTHCWDAADNYSRLDYLFVSRAMKPFVDLPHSFIYDSPKFNDASDHRPLVATLLLEPRKTEK